MSSRGARLVVVDMQAIFADPASPWATPRYAAVEPVVVRLVAAFGDNVVFTRFVAPAEPHGAWVEYYRQWPFALVPADDPLYELSPAFAPTGHPVITSTTFGKWGPDLDAALGATREIVLVGVSTDCCVLSTALAAADAGVAVRVVADATAGLTDADHERALHVLALYAPLITITSAGAVLEEITG